MTKHSKSYFVALLLFFTIVLTAQDSSSDFAKAIFQPEMTVSELSSLPSWAQLMYESPHNIAQIQEAYTSFYQSNDFVKTNHTQFYKRLIRKHSRITFNPEGLSKSQRLQDQIKYQKKRKNQLLKSVNQWSVIGPLDLDLTAPATGATPGTAHIYHLEFCEGLSQHMLAGTATAGLWKSSNSAQTWELITSDLLVNEVKAAIYEPMNPSVIYFTASGNFYKTVDGGYNWSITGGAELESNNFEGLEIIIPADNPNILYLATNIGLFKSSDKGETFSEILDGNIRNVVLHPTNHDIIYTIEVLGNKTVFHRSLDGGLSFEAIENGYPVAGSTEDQRRAQIAVSADEPDAIWAIVVGKVNGGDGLVGIYKSANQGELWTRKCCGDSDGGPASASNQNVMEWDCSGLNNGGQYYYDLAIAVNPTNADQLVTGGINIWKSEDSGTNMQCISDFIYRHNPETYVHADIHKIKYNNGKIWVASDGGIFVSNDNMQSFQKSMHGIVGTDFKGFGLGFFDKDIMVGGTYHNGTLLKEGSTYNNDWVSTRSGDNSRAFVNDGDNSLIYDQSSMRELNGDRNNPPHDVALPRKPNASFIPGESSEIVFDPFHHNSLYLGQGASLYHSENNGVTFDRIKSFSSGRVTAIEKSVTNPALMYVVHYPSYSAPKKIMRSTNGGLSFSDVTPPVSMFNNEDLWVAMDITIGSHNPFEIWLARVPQSTSGLNLDGLQVFYSANGGDDWVNWSTDVLDGEYPSNIVHQQGTNGGVYLGTRRGVFYRSHTTGDWEMQSAGIPASTYSTKLIPHYKSGKIVNATARGIYEMPFVEAGTAIATPTVDKRASDCLRDTFYFVDRSPVLENATRTWTFTGATTPNSTEANPKVVYDTPGVYPVELQVSAGGTSATFSQNTFLTVNDGCKIDSFIGSHLKLGGTAYGRIPAYKRSFSEMTISAWVKRQGIIYSTAGVVLHRAGPNGTGLIIRSNGELSYLWDELDNTYHSGLTVPYNSWTHIAMAISGTEVRMYVNGIESKLTINLEELELLESFYIGGDAFSVTNYLGGNIDEVSIYDRALSSEEIRLCMNLTQTNPLPNLLSYFQANNVTGKLTDRVGHSHAYMMNSATRENSNAPVGSGCAEMHVIDMPGTYDFDCASLSMTFEADDILPMGPVSVSRLNTLPDMPNPEGSAISENYWIINNGGTNQLFSEPSLLKINNFGRIDSIYEEYPEIHKLYKVPTYWEYGWGNSFADADSVNLLDNTSLFYENAAGITSSGKLIFAEEGFPALSVAQFDLSVHIQQDKSRLIEWDFMQQVHSYEISRSFDGINFEKIATIDHKSAKQEARFVDKEKISGQLYYRVLGLSFDEESYLSEVKRVFVLSEENILFYPSVLSESESLTVVNPLEEKLQMNVYNLQGQRVVSRLLWNENESVILNLFAGQYVIELIQNEQLVTGRIVVQ